MKSTGHYHTKPKDTPTPALDHIMEIMEETGAEMCYSQERTETYCGHVLQLFYDENSYQNGFKCFVTGFGTFSGCSFECAKRSAIISINR